MGVRNNGKFHRRITKTYRTTDHKRAGTTEFLTTDLPTPSDKFLDHSAGYHPIASGLRMSCPVDRYSGNSPRVPKSAAQQADTRFR